MKNFSILLVLLFLTIPINRLTLLDDFPIWLKDNSKRTDQSSGITFIGEKNNQNYFLICDDIGKIHHIRLKHNSIKINTVGLSDKVEDFLRMFEKKDFEEIVYDKWKNEVYLSIEGNGSDFLNEAGIYKLRFKNNDVFEDEIVDIEKISFSQWNVLSKYLSQNIGFEGIGISENRIFLGLEGFQYGDLFLDSTLIYIIDKNSKHLIKEISTKKLNIHTICGLYAINDYHLLGIDRNKQNFFEIKFDKNYNIESIYIEKLNLPVPGKRDLKYVAAIESITLDQNNFVYVIDDPWKKFYVPPINILQQLKKEDQKNFKEFIPLLFKYKLN